MRACCSNALAKRGEGALQPQLLQCVRAEPARDPAHLLGAVPGRLAQLVELAAKLVGDAGGEPFDLQDHAGEGLADFVVQLARDPPALGLLNQQRLSRTLATLGLQPVEHVVERLRQRDHDGTAADLGAPPWRQRVMLAHGFGEMLERSERRTQQDHIGGQQRDQAERRARAVRPLRPAPRR